MAGGQEPAEQVGGMQEYPTPTKSQQGSQTVEQTTGQNRLQKYRG